MKYFPVFKRKIDIERNDVTVEEIADMLSKNGDYRITGIYGDCVKCSKINKPEMGYYSFNPDFNITLVKNGEKTELHCLYHLKNFVQVFLYIYNLFAVAMQIAVLFLAQGEIIFPCFIPIILIAYSLLLPALALRYQANRITEDIKCNAKILS